MKADRSFSKKDRILMHIEKARRYLEELDAPRTFSQDGIAEAIGITRAHAALELSHLAKAGLVEDARKHVPEKMRQVKMYAPTRAGYELAKALRAIREMRE